MMAQLIIFSVENAAATCPLVVITIIPPHPPVLRSMYARDRSSASRGSPSGCCSSIAAAVRASVALMIDSPWPVVLIPHTSWSR